MQQPAHHYDSATTVFSPDGRIYQVEYAREVVKRGTTVVAVTAKDGVGFLAGRREGSRLAIQESVEKIFKIDDHIACASCGLVADARRLVSIARHISTGHTYLYDEPITVDALVRDLSNRLHGYTQTGGNRPFGVALLIGGLDGEEARIFETDPSGAYVGYRAAALGNRAEQVRARLEQRFSSELTLEEGLAAAYSALSEGATEARAASFEGALVTPDGFRRLSADEIAEIAGNSEAYDPGEAEEAEPEAEAAAEADDEEPEEPGEGEA